MPFLSSCQIIAYLDCRSKCSLFPWYTINDFFLSELKQNTADRYPQDILSLKILHDTSPKEGDTPPYLAVR